jgi:hypothetical protein
MAKRSIYSLNILFAGEGGDERIDEAIQFLMGKFRLDNLRRKWQKMADFDTGPAK